MAQLDPDVPVALMVLKDGHVGSEWFSEAISRQPRTRFIFEMGPCITGSMDGKRAFMTNKRGCSCTKEDCVLFRGEIGRAPCLSSPSRQSCRLLGSSHISMTSAKEMQQWQSVLANTSGVTVLVQTRSNLAKWAWSFYRTGAMRRLREGLRGRNASGSHARPQGSDTQIPKHHIPKEQIHLRNASNRGSQQAIRVDPKLLYRMIVAKQKRSERLLSTGRTLYRERASNPTSASA
jgi:hypothetical protein